MSSCAEATLLMGSKVVDYAAGRPVREGQARGGSSGCRGRAPGQGGHPPEDAAVRIVPHRCTGWPGGTQSARILEHIRMLWLRLLSCGTNVRSATLMHACCRETERNEFAEAKDRLKHSWAADRDDFARVKDALKKKNADHHIQNGRLSQALKVSSDLILQSSQSRRRIWWQPRCPSASSPTVHVAACVAGNALFSGRCTTAAALVS